MQNNSACTQYNSSLSWHVHVHVAVVSAASACERLWSMWKGVCWERCKSTLITPDPYSLDLTVTIILMASSPDPNSSQLFIVTCWKQHWRPASPSPNAYMDYCSRDKIKCVHDWLLCVFQWICVTNLYRSFWVIFAADVRVFILASHSADNRMLQQLTPTAIHNRVPDHE